MNWKLRLRNKTTLAALIATLIPLVYQVISLFGVVPTISPDQATNYIGVLLNLLTTLGVLIDPTTKGIKDSAAAKAYTNLGE